MGEDSEELLEYATDAARRDVIGKEQVGKDLARMSRERVLLRVEILEKVARYEAHLFRGACLSSTATYYGRSLAPKESGAVGFYGRQIHHVEWVRYVRLPTSFPEGPFSKQFGD
jgi:hypothetical protein